jgi:hypothetical protein
VVVLVDTVLDASCFEEVLQALKDDLGFGVELCGYLVGVAPLDA